MCSDTNESCSKGYDSNEGLRGVANDKSMYSYHYFRGVRGHAQSEIACANLYMYQNKLIEICIRLCVFCSHVYTQKTTLFGQPFIA